MPRFDRVDFAYSAERPVLDRFSLELPDQGTICLLGRSGCGKTTLLRLLAGLRVPQAGTLTRPEGRLTMVFQEDRLLPWETVWKNATSQPGSAHRQLAQEWLVRLGLEPDLDRLPAELSGGMKRRVAIARALAAEPEVLLLDEPFSGLDASTWRQAADLIRSVAGIELTVLVTHIEEHAEVLGAQVIRLDGPPLRVG